ncbi:sugar transferase [Demequina sp. NBRC 110055]|uniref:sugar transferase n=1 Tax=Demequina sp. NBRC 110055 TaxID=1570344 RepID=UPI001184FC5C|nr:sugar transferase [Demequina sp. NBRC 110055]
MAEDPSETTPSDVTGAVPLVRPSTQRMRGRRGWAKKYERRLAVSDLFVVTLSMALAHGVRFGWEPFIPVQGDNGPAYALVTVAIIVVWVVLLGWSKSRDAAVLGHGPEEFQRVMHASWLVFAGIAIVGFLTQWQISRGYLLFAIPFGTLMLLVYRAAWRSLVKSQRDAGQLQAQCVVVGPPKTVRQMIRRLHSVPRAGYAVIGACLPGSGADRHESIEGVSVLGGADDAAELAIHANAEYVILAGTDAMSLRETKELGWELEGTGVGLIVVPTIVDVAGPRVSMSPVDGLPLMHVDAPRFEGGRYALKNTLDRITAFMGLLVLAIPMALVAIAIKLESPGPVFFKQIRVGVDHRLFTMYKFRSMYTDAEQRLAALHAVQGVDAGNEVLFKMKDDPRVTRVGKFLRRFSIDELPQLINVLKGNMSLVGPRPPLPREVEQWEENVGRRQLVKPGLTGLWQVSGRSDLDWEQSVRLDLYYAENWSIGGDLVILARTAWAVVAGRGAY